MDQEQLLIRSFSPDQDIPRLLSLYAAVEAVDLDGNQVSEQELRDQLNSVGSDPLKDRWVAAVAANPTVLVGSAMVRVRPGTTDSDANIVIHPDWRQHEIGSALLTRVIERARQLEAASVQIYANTRRPEASGFLQKHGFSPQGAYTELRLSIGVRLPPVIWPYGYTMRSYAEIGDVSILTQAMNLAYIPLWGHHEVTEDEMAAWLPELNPHNIFLVFSEKGRVVGISRVELSPERTAKNGVPTGYIDAPGVVPQHRRLDLYRALVLTGINWLQDRGQTTVEMESWGDKLEVLKMYRELGFKDLRQLICYQIDLSITGKDDRPVSP